MHLDYKQIHHLKIWESLNMKVLNKSIFSLRGACISNIYIAITKKLLLKFKMQSYSSNDII